MKKVLTIATVILFATAPAAFAGNHETPGSKTSTYESSFSKLEVQDGIEVMLVESPDKSIEFKGDDAAIAKVDWKIRNGVMVVYSKKKSLKGKVKIVLSVSNLKELYVKDGAEVSSDGKLNSEKLKIIMDGDSFVAVQSNGNISLEGSVFTDLEVRRVAGDVEVK